MPYIGPYEIDTLTDKGPDHFIATFHPVKREDNGEMNDVTPQLFANAIKDTLITEEPMDLNYIRTQRCDPAVRDTLATLVKYAIGVKEFDYFGRLLADSVNNASKEADTLKWGHEQDQHTITDTHMYLLEQKALKESTPSVSVEESTATSTEVPVEA